MSIQNDSNTETKTVLITGGSRGLGRNMAVSLAKAGFDVVITYHANESAATEVVKEIHAFGRHSAAFRLDTGDIKSFPAFLANLRIELSRMGHESLFGLVNNAGIGLMASFAETTEETFDQLLNVHFKGVFFLTQKLLPLIQDGGRVINISSGLARVSLPGFSVYGAAKGAIEVLSRYLAKELAERRITVNVVAPGGIETDFGGGSLRDNPDVNAFIASQTALGRAGLPDDIGPFVAALFSDSHRWINGQKIEVSGGWAL